MSERPLSKREKQIIFYLRLGVPRKAIAFALKVSYGTVSSYVRKIYNKLGIKHNGVRLAVWLETHPEL